MVANGDIARRGCERAALRVERVTTRDGLDRLRPEWDALWAAVPTRTPFQHSAWLVPWWDTFGDGDDGGDCGRVSNELRVLTVLDDERCIGVIPMMLMSAIAKRAESPASSHEPQRDTPNRLPSAELRLLGGGISDYLDLLAMPGAERTVAHVIARELDRTADEWQLCAFDSLRPSSPLLQVDPPRDARETREAEPPCPVLSLPASLDAKLAADIRYGRHRADRLGGLTVTRAEPDTLQDMLTVLFDLHGQRWCAKGERGVLADAAVRAFHRLAAPALLDAGLLRLFALSAGGKTIAAYYALRAAGRVYCYLGGFDPAFSQLGPGKLALAAVLDDAVTEGASEMDFLAGGEPYKYQWHAVDRPRVHRHFIRPYVRDRVSRDPLDNR
jgi:CelD/BcsL family acetyltransferase involved in cellulose biosynthesis